MTDEPTPRTDAALAYGWLSDEFVRQLEREVRSCQQSLVSMHERAENAERELSLAQSRLAEFHKLLDECKVSRRYSLTAGREWIDYPLAERLRIVLDANKLCDQEIAESYESLAEVEKDAARYRWLREHFRFSHDSLHELWFDENVSPHAAETICDREALDASIDEAIKRSSR